MKLTPAFAALLTDSYKLSHKLFTTPGTQQIYSNFTPRFTHYLKQLYPLFDDQIVFFGLQAAIKEIFCNMWNDTFFNQPKNEVIAEMKRVLTPYIGMSDFSHFEQLHDLGYLPIEIKALPEGALVQPNIPVFTIKNTHADFQWLPNYLETILSAQIWKPMTVATVGRLFRSLANAAAIKTTGTTDGVDFQLHDFSFRGQSGFESSAANGAGFLLSSLGSDNIPAIMYLEQYYNADISKEPIAYSVPAGEHSVTTLGITMSNPEDKYDGEVKYIDFVLDQFKTGIVSYVADSYDYWNVIENILPIHKDKIMSREGKFVIRGDSGNPVDIITGATLKYAEVSKESAETFEDFMNICKMRIANKVESTTPTNKEGVSTYSMSFKWNDKLWDVTASQLTWVRSSLNYWQVDIRTAVMSFVEKEIDAEYKGTIEALWDLFGGTVNELGYKVLDSHIGMIYGDGITFERATEIFQRLEAKGFASTNIVFGVGLTKWPK